MENSGSCVWTDEEVGVLLNITLQYKIAKLRDEELDWESCKQKYSDITARFHEVLSQKQKSKDFPRINGETTKSQLTTKLKNIRGKYRQAVESGRRSGYGRTVLIYYELCDKIWGGGDIELIKGFPRTPALESGIEAMEFNEVEVRTLSSSESPGPGFGSATEQDADWSPRRSPRRSPHPSPPVTGRARRVPPRLQKTPPPVNGHFRPGTLKRRAPRDADQDELDIKRSMLELLRTQAQRADERMERLVSSMEALVNVISHSHSQIMNQSQCCCSHRPLQAKQSHSSDDTHTALKVTDAFSLALKTEDDTDTE